MIDERHAPSSSAETTASPAGGSEAHVGFCQECGRALTPGTLRRVGNGIFCVLCSTQGQTTGWQPVGSSTYPGAGAPGTVPPVAPGDPSPGLASLLGFIPGVGAMYNGQYAKGAMHLVIFVLLVTLADNLNWVFYWLVWGWVFYQVFDAYHTARARRDGLPLPNPFGWNELGDRLGFHRTSPPEPSAGNPGPATSRRATANWAGYVPPSGPGRPTYVPYAAPPSENPYTAAYTEAGVPPPVPPVPPVAPLPFTVPYAPTFTGSVPGQPLGAPSQRVGTRRFPIGALWLIGLGVLFLLGNLLPEWRLSGRWLVPILLAGVAAWSALRRWEQFQATSLAVGSSAPSLAGAMVGPVMLFAVAMLLALQAGHVLSLHRSWPILLVVWGGMLLLQRTAPSPLQSARPAMPEAVPPQVRSTSGTGSLGL